MIEKSVSDPAHVRGGWFTSSYSNSSGSCVEIKFDHGTVSVRDSKDRRAQRPIIGMPSAGWTAFLNTVTVD